MNHSALIIEQNAGSAAKLTEFIRCSSIAMDCTLSDNENYPAILGGFKSKGIRFLLLFFEISSQNQLPLLLNARAIEIETGAIVVVYSKFQHPGLKQVVIQETGYIYMNALEEIPSIISIAEESQKRGASPSKATALKEIKLPSGQFFHASKEEELELYVNVINQLPDLIYAKDKNSRFLLANQAVANIMGVDSPSDLIGKQDADFFPVDYWAKFYAKEQAIIRGELENITTEEPVIDLKTKNRRWLISSKFPLIMSGSKIQGIVGLGKDITDRKELEDQLKELRSIVNQSHTVALLVKADEDWTIEFTTDNIDLFGYKKETLNNAQSYKALIHPDDLEQVIQKIEKYCRNKSPDLIHQYRLRTNTGEYKWLEDHTKFRKDEEGKITHFQSVVRDITWKVNARKEKIRLQQQLLQVQKLEAIGELSAGIAHELNTPIQFIGDNIRFLQESSSDLVAFVHKVLDLVQVQKEKEHPDSVFVDLMEIAESMDLNYLLEEMPDALNQSLEGVNRVSEIVLAMKDFSHPGDTSLQSIDINKSLRTTSIVAKNEWKYCAEIVFELSEDLPLLPCYPGKLNQALLNMVINAAHAIESKRKEYDDQALGKITLRSEEKEGAMVISISDTGTGIPVAAQDKIFDPFFTTKEVGKGTGQGLAITFDVINKTHHGNVEFITEENKGTTFIITLPLKADNALKGEKLSHV